MAQTSTPATGALSALSRLFTQPISFGGTRSSLSSRSDSPKRPGSVGHKQMRRDLYSLLERHPASRQTMRHLDLIERTLRRMDIDAVEALPVKVLAKGLDELEALVRDWSAEGLAEVRSRLAVKVKERRHEASALTTSQFERYDSHAPQMQAEVNEVSHELYEEMERSWSGQMPAELAAAQRAMALVGTETPAIDPKPGD
jgi:hypothetical protein